MRIAGDSRSSGREPASDRFMVGSHAIPRASGTGDASLEMPGLRVSVARSRRVARGLCPLPLVFFSSIAWRAKIKTEREAMNGIQFVTDEKGRKVAVQRSEEHTSELQSLRH